MPNFDAIALAAISLVIDIQATVPENLTGFTVWVRGCLYMFSFVLPLLFSCTGTPDIKESRAFQVIESMPFYPQEASQCGPVSLACVLNYWRTGVSPEDVAGEIYSTSAKGTLDIDMILYAERKGLKARQYKGSADDIKRNIDLGYPLIVLVDYGFWVYQQNHFMVVVGYNKNGILANSGRDQLKFIPFKVFLKSWKKTSFLKKVIYMLVAKCSNSEYYFIKKGIFAMSCELKL